MEVDEFATGTETSEEGRRARRRQLSQQAIALAMQSRWQEASDNEELSLTIFRELGDSRGEGRVLNGLGLVAWRQGDLTTAQDCYQRALAIQQKLASDSLDVAASLVFWRELPRFPR